MKIVYRRKQGWRLPDVHGQPNVKTNTLEVVSPVQVTVTVDYEPKDTLKTRLIQAFKDQMLADSIAEEDVTL